MKLQAKITAVVKGGGVSGCFIECPELKDVPDLTNKIVIIEIPNKICEVCDSSNLETMGMLVCKKCGLSQV